MPVWNFVRPGVYRDSVTLMRLSRDLEAIPGVGRAAAMLGTPANRALLEQAGLLGPEGAAAGPADLVVAVLAADARVAADARAAAEQALAARRPPPGAGSGAAPPRTLGSALRALPDATLALVSVPGPWAGAEAMKALRTGLHVMLFSDNVPLETEIALKREARTRSLLLMGPDCGTAIVRGVALGFANAVPSGRIGLAAASGTGLQEVACQIAAAGEGISHAIGVGGRDLSDEVGGAMMTEALAALAADPATEVVGIVGKPPGAATLARLAAAAARLGKPCVAHFPGGPARPGAWHAAASLEDTARAAVALARGTSPSPVEFTLPAEEIERLITAGQAGLRSEQRFVRGLYGGGTLAWEAVAILRASLDDVAPGITGDGAGHRVVDLGDDLFTRGRPHPMLDGTVRREWIDRAGRDPATAVLLLDLVLGYGAHPDPAGEILEALLAAHRAAAAAGRRLAVVASVCGTDRDPQGRAAQVAALRAAGVVVMPSNAQAARLAARIARRP